MNSSPVRLAFATIAVAMLALTGCAQGAGPAPSPNPDDGRALAQLADIAPAGAEIEGDVTATECWSPSDHLLSAADGGSGSTFRVLCRVHYEAARAERYRDMICIGDLDTDPVADHCYRWAYYTDMPKYEDAPGYAA